MEKIQIHAERDINVPVEKVFEFITDPHNVPLVLPGLIENTNIPKLPIKAGDKFNFKFHLLGILINGITTIDKVENPGVYDFSTSGDNISHWKQRFINKNGITHFVLDIEYEPPQSWLEKMKIDFIKKMNIKDAEHYFDNLNAVLELQV